ncbi:unnamed protein product [Nesidiocoris tenuis]|uniref:Mab-21-like HhH/H2TH-like domain-containing protein n=1 Tax=Nesidiocoris tenuis TaxID=355587 RepID=A0A6H5H4Y7_9HEMI|nr:unnamed protein product [Nesidiocoris tenuis]
MLSFPPHAVRRPLHAVRRPPHAVRRPLHAVRRPPSTVRGFSGGRSCGTFLTFSPKIRDPVQEKSLVLIERLIQRLIVGVSILDPRFSSKFLVNLEPFKLSTKPGNSLSYLVRLDELSSPSLYPYGGEEIDEAGGPHCQLVEPEGGPQGFARLRISGPGSHRWVEFVGSQGYLRRDSSNCWQHQLEDRLWLADRRKSTRAFRAEVLGKSSTPRTFIESWRLNIGFFMARSWESVSRLGRALRSSPRGLTSPILTVCCTTKPRQRDFTSSLHPPHPTLRCDDRASAWQIRFPAAEQTLLKHYSANSMPSRVLAVLRALLYEIRATNNGSFHLTSSLIMTLSFCFIVMLNSPGGGTLHYTEEDYNHDADLLCYHLRRLGDIAPCGPHGGDSDPWRRVETSLILKWTAVLADLMPPQSTRGTRMAFYPLSSSGPNSAVDVWRHRTGTIDHLEPRRPDLFDFIDTGTGQIGLCRPPLGQPPMSWVFTVLTKLRSKQNPPPPTRTTWQLANFWKMSRRTGRKSTSKTTMLLEVLKWLYYGMDKDRRNLAPILRPYLTRLFTVSHENCWYLAEWQKRQESDELDALTKFSKLVTAGLITAHDGVVDAYQKGWTWAESMMKTSSELADGLELIFTPSPGKVHRYRITDDMLRLDNALPAVMTASRSLGRRRAISEQKGFGSATLPRHIKPFREHLKSRIHRCRTDDEMLTTSHSILRAASPMTQASETVHRFGNHRGLGSIVHALISLRKFSTHQVGPDLMLLAQT